MRLMVTSKGSHTEQSDSYTGTDTKWVFNTGAALSSMHHSLEEEGDTIQSSKARLN